MQLDQTQIAIRERGMADTMDLALHVLRSYCMPILLTFALGAAPFFLLNDWLIGWMAVPLNPGFYSYDDGWMVARFIWDMSLLVFLQAQVASVFTTAYLGRVMFLEKPRLWSLVWEVLAQWGPLLWCQFLLRAIVPACLFMMAIDPEEEVPAIELLVLPSLALYAALVRAIRPFINEIVLLEKNPLFSRQPSAITVAVRSARLHGPGSGDLFVAWMVSAILGCVLSVLIYGGFVFVFGVLTHNWSYPPIMIRFVLPASMWLVACYFAVVRFMRYLDLRIRQEGWEVELRMRAEASRLRGKAVRKLA